jgi:TPP-dependent pyruvate/acetoin dehydrogenase alpha subunit
MTGNITTQTARVAGKKGFSLISDDQFRQLYAALLQCRMLDQRLPISSSYERWTGREAASAAVVACLRAGDSVTATTRGVLAAYLQNGSVFPNGNHATPSTDLATATCDALRHKLEKKGNIAVVFAGEGEPDRMSETFAAAAGQLLPVFYVMQSSASLAEVRGTLPVIRVDGSDAVALYRVAHESIMRAREGGGATIMECVADDDARDPLAMLERYLAGKELFRNTWKRRLEKQNANALDQAVKSACCEEP